MNASARRLGRRMLNVYREIDPIARRRAYLLRATCREGCDHCCKQYTPITLAECILVVEHLLSRPGGEQRLEEVLARARDLVPRLPEPGDGVYPPCPLLMADHRCEVYAARPTACRTYFVVSNPVTCDTRAGVADVEIISMRDLHLHTVNQGARAVREEGHDMLWWAPLPVAIILAAIFLREGRAGLDAAITEYKGSLCQQGPLDGLPSGDDIARWESNFSR